MKNYYEFYNPVKIIAGINTIENDLGNELKNLNSKRVFVVSGPIINKLGLTDSVIENIKKSGIEVCGCFTNVPNESSKETIREICDLYLLNSCDSLVAVGGGSVLDTVKVVKLCLSQNCFDLDKLYGFDMVREGINIPMILIPTTCGTGSEVTRVAVISDEDLNCKSEILSNVLLPDACVLDPEMLKTLPKKSIVLTAFDALSHAIEAYCGKQKNPISDRFAIYAITLIFENLPICIENEYCKETENNFLNLLKASYCAGVSFSNSMVGAVHAIAHSIGHCLNVGHDFAITSVLPYLLEYNVEWSQNDYAELYLKIATKEEYKNTKATDRANAFVKKIKSFIDENVQKIGGIPKLAECGISADKYNEIIEKAYVDGAILTNSRPFQKEDIAKVLNMILEKSV